MKNTFLKDNTQNNFFDIVIIGASKEGIAVYKKLQKEAPTKTICIISDKGPKNNKNFNIFCIIDTVVYVSYNHGLIGLTLLSDKGIPKIFTEHLILATGECPIKFPKKGADISELYYDIDTIPSNSKNNQAVVFGIDERAAKFALALHTKFKYVYLCTNLYDLQELQCTETTKNKILATKNIAVLPGCQIVSWTRDPKNKCLCKVSLDTYSTINCIALYISIGRVPDTRGIPTALITKDSTGHIQTQANCRTFRVPNIYAIGKVSDFYNKSKEKLLIEELKDKGV